MLHNVHGVQSLGNLHFCERDLLLQYELLSNSAPPRIDPTQNWGTFRNSQFSHFQICDMSIVFSPF